MKLFSFVLAFALAGTCCHAQPAPIELHILADGHVRFGNGPELDRKQWQAEVKKLMQMNPRPDIRPMPERLAHYDLVAQILSDFQNAGYGPHFGFTGISK